MVIKERDRKLDGVFALKNLFAFHDVTSIANMLTVFSVFLILLYFPHSSSSLIVLQRCLCHVKVFEVNVFRLCFEHFSFDATTVASQKLSLVELKFEMRLFSS